MLYLFILPAVLMAPTLTEDQIRTARSMSPVPPPPSSPTNAMADDPAAALLGQSLFFEPGISGKGTTSCSSCHQPTLAFSDGRHVSTGAGVGIRNAPTLLGAAHQRWFFWDGRADSLWMQATHPIEDPLEMNAARGDVVQFIAHTPQLRRRYESLFGPILELGALPAGLTPKSEQWNSLTSTQQQSVNEIFVNLCKCLAAYERQLQPGDSDFDRWVASFESPDAGPALSDSAIRGFQLFTGDAGCWQCHFGPLLSDREFHDLGLPAPDGSPSTDPGRGEGYATLRASSFRADGPWSDAPESRAARRAAAARIGPEHWGAFRTPSLRNVALTAPYMHDGRFASIAEVLEFYNTLETQARRHHHAEDVLQPLNLNAAQLADLEAFLRSLSGAPPATHLLGPLQDTPPTAIPGDQIRHSTPPAATKGVPIHE